MMQKNYLLCFSIFWYLILTNAAPAPVGCSDGGQIITVANTLTGTEGFGYHTVEEIPAGARNITITKANTNLCFYLALQSEGQAVLNGGFIIQGTASFSAIGSEFHYTRSASNEYVSSSGPLQQELTVQALLARRGSYKLTVKYLLCS